VISMDALYNGWLRRAQDRGWKLPPEVGNPPGGKRAWALYWAGCASYEEDPERKGRPVAPHRPSQEFPHGSVS
jgi:hypothetical protein